MNGPCEKRKRQLSLISPLLHQLPPAPILVIKHLLILWNPKPGYCVQNPGKGDAASSTVSSLIWTVWLLRPAVHLLGSVWRGGIRSSGRLSRNIWQSCSFSLAQMYVLNAFCFFPLSLEQVKLQPCSAVTPKLSFGGCRHGLCKECWTLIIFAPGMNLQ